MLVAMSALGVSVVVTDERVGVPSLLVGEPLLFVAIGSGVSELLLAVLLMALRVVGVTKLTVRVVLTAFASVGSVGKVTIPVIGLYVPPSDAVTPIKPGMMLSVMVTLVAGSGPLFVVVRLYVTVDPTVLTIGPLLVVTRSAMRSVTVVKT